MRPFVYASKVVLQLPISNSDLLAPFVEDCLEDKVALIAVWGPDCSAIHDLIDDIVLGDGSDEERLILTSWHEGETLEEAMEFAAVCGEGGAAAVQLVKL